MRSGGGGGSCSWLGNAGGVYGVRSDSLKVGCICQVEGSFKVYTEAPFFRYDEKWTCAFIIEFLLGSWEIQVGRVEPIPCLLLDTQ